MAGCPDTSNGAVFASISNARVAIRTPHSQASAVPTRAPDGRHQQYVIRLQGRIVSRSQASREILALRVVTPAISAREIFAEQHRHLHGIRQFVGALTPARVMIDHAGHVQAAPVENRGCCLSSSAASPPRPRSAARWRCRPHAAHGRFVDARAQLAQLARGDPHGLVDRFLEFASPNASRRTPIRRPEMPSRIAPR